MLIAYDLFFFRVPFNWCIKPNTDIGHVADCIRADGVFDRADGFGPGFYAVDEIAYVVIAVVEMDVVRTQFDPFKFRLTGI